MMFRTHLPAIVAGLFAFQMMPVLKADVTGTLLGRITDPSGAVVPDVVVAATNTETNFKRTAKTDATGEFRLLSMPVGHYRLEASHTGFQKFVSTGIELAVNDQRRVDISLQVGSVEQLVEVNAASIQVESTNSQLGEVIESRKLTT